MDSRIRAQINRINTKLAECYDAITQKGGTFTGKSISNLLPDPSSFSLNNITNSSGVLTYTANTTAMAQYSLSTPVAGHKYYGRVDQKVPAGTTFGDGRFEYYGGDGAGKNIVFTSFSDAIADGQWHTYSSIQSFPSISGTGWTLRSFAVNATNTVYRRNHIIIDLTAIFGSGNEPTKEWCDASILYFTGTKTIAYPMNSANLASAIATIPSNTATVVATSDTSGATMWAEKGSKQKYATSSGTTYTMGGLDEYDGWTVKGTTAGSTITLGSVTVEEAKTYNIDGTFYATATAASNNTSYGTATVNDTSSVTVLKGTSVSLKATPADGYKFDKWSDRGSQNHNATVTKTTTYTATFSKQSSSCVSGDTLITLADRSTKRIDQLTYNDMLLAYNLDTGFYEAAGISKIYCHGLDAEVAELLLTFSNNSEIKIIPPHGFLDCTRLEFVQIDSNDFEQYIGDEFLLDNGEKAVLESVEFIDTVDEAWSLITKDDENFIANGLVSITGHRYALFPITENMIFDAEVKQSDIDTYGVFEYEQFADKMSEEDFYDLNCQYYKIPLEKGIIDMDYIEREIPLLISYNVIPKDAVEEQPVIDVEAELVEESTEE